MPLPSIAAQRLSSGTKLHTPPDVQSSTVQGILSLQSDLVQHSRQPTP
jgi:hypothetical protein